MARRLGLLAASVFVAIVVAASAGPMATARPARGGAHLYVVTTTHNYVPNSPGSIGVFVDNVEDSAEGAITISQIEFTMPSGVVLDFNNLPPHCAPTGARTATCRPLAIGLAQGRYLRFVVPVVTDPVTAPGVYRNGSATVTYTLASTGASGQQTAPLQATRLGICVPHPEQPGRYVVDHRTTDTGTNVNCSHQSGQPDSFYTTGFFNDEPLGRGLIDTGYGSSDGTAGGQTITVTLPPGVTFTPLGQPSACKPSGTNEIRCPVPALPANTLREYALSTTTTNPAQLSPSGYIAQVTITDAVGYDAQISYYHGDDCDNDEKSEDDG